MSFILETPPEKIPKGDPVDYYNKYANAKIKKHYLIALAYFMERFYFYVNMGIPSQGKYDELKKELTRKINEIKRKVGTTELNRKKNINEYWKIRKQFSEVTQIRMINVISSV